MKKALKRCLFAFDFDQTIINGDSDFCLQEILIQQKYPINDIAKLYEQGVIWNKIMQDILKFLGEKNITTDQLKQIQQKNKLNKGMKELFNHFKQFQNNFDIIIISDGNQAFIRWSLENIGIYNQIKKLYANPVSFDERGRLSLHPYGQYECSICPKNICKKDVLNNHIKQQGPYDKLYYAGDGLNDFHPIQHLSSTDYAFIRNKFQLQQKLQTLMSQGDLNKIVQAKIHYWDDAFSILQIIKEDFKIG